MDRCFIPVYDYKCESIQGCKLWTYKDSVDVQSESQSTISQLFKNRIFEGADLPIDDTISQKYRELVTVADDTSFCAFRLHDGGYCLNQPITYFSKKSCQNLPIDLCDYTEE